MQKKYFLLATFLLIVASFFYLAIPKSNGKKNVYYQSGELLIRGDRQILIAPNGREIEFIEISKKDKLIKLNEINAIGNPYQILIKETPTGTYAISLEGDFIVEYDISDLTSIKVIKKIGPLGKDYDYYYDIAPYKENKFLTAGEKGITIWDANTLSILEKIYDKRTTNVEGYNSSIYAFGEEGAIIFNAERKKIVDPYIKSSLHQHQIFVDEIGTGYFPGDDALKMRTYTTYKNFAHPSSVGNAAAGFYGSNLIYFANGWDVYKLDKNLNILDTKISSGKSGEWSAGLRTCDLDQGKRIIVFNGQDILLMDEDLNVLDEYSYTPSDNSILSEKTMKISPKQGKIGQPVMVAASGFWPGETVGFNFAGFAYTLRANDLGEIFEMAEVPQAKAGKTNISIVGKQSSFSHSAPFEVKE